MECDGLAGVRPGIRRDLAHVGSAARRAWACYELRPLQATKRLHIVSMDQVFKALADASRRELLDRLRADNGQTLNELCARLDMTRQAVSKHLGILEEANLVATVKQGREKLHYLNPVPIHAIAERWIGKFERHRLQALSELKKGLEARDE
jgi:DNA-binding transcriptional ArsR family regulator